MYTECPECRSAFRLTVTVLRQAHGRVRCGSCGHVFDALDHLHEEAGDAAPADAEQTSAGVRFERRSRELLQTLDELAGPDEVRIEDTGIEWRVYDDEEADEDGSAAANETSTTGSIRWQLHEGPAEDGADGPQGGTDAEASASEAPSAPDDGLTLEDTRDWRLDDEADDDAPAAEPDAAAARNEPRFDDTQTRLDLDRDAADEMRYDDNTPLPDDAGEAEPPPTLRRRAEDFAPPPVDHEFQEDLALGDPDDWRALLTEVDSGSEVARQAHDEPAAGDADVPRLDDAVEVAADGTVQRPAPGTGIRSATEAGAIAAERELDEALADATADGGTDRRTGAREAAARSDDDAVERRVDEQMPHETDDGDPTTSREPPTDSGLYETIVMEGDTIRSVLDDEEDESAADDRPPEAPIVIEPAAPEEDAAPEPRRPAWQGIAAAAVLALALGAQLVHANRESLATIDAVHQALDPIYRTFGTPLTPAWDIRGWRFEATNGSTDGAGQRLIIYSRLSNQSDGALPYPLVHISLTDRFEEVIGSRILAAGEYLAGDTDPTRSVRPGRNFTAVITIDAPAEAATGFKLNVCYRLASERLRCAIEDFKD